MLRLVSGRARCCQRREVGHDRLSELRLRLRLQPVLLLRRLISTARVRARKPGMAGVCAGRGQV
jgi:hypothetical protein